MTTCTLCDLPTPDPPVTDPSVAGEFCCRGCLEVARTLSETDAGGTETADDGQSVAASADADEARAVLDTGDDPDTADGEEAYLSVEGMHCATCEAFLESRAAAHSGVTGADASYAASMVKVTYDPGRTDPDAVADALSGVGYRASHADERDEREDGTGARLVIGGFFGMMTMLWYVLFLYPTYFGLPPETLLLDVTGPAGTYLVANIWVMATVVLGYTGYPILRGAYVSLAAREPNMDLLVALAAGTAYVYSVVAALVGHAEVYFDITVVVVLVVTLGNYYETRLKERAAGRLGDLTEDRVDRARRRTNEGVELVDIDALAAGDEVVVKSGERVPVDGTVAEGTAAVDQSLVTGESRPVRTGPGDDVVGGALVADGGLVVEVGDGATSTLDRLTTFLWEVQSTRPGAARLADRIAAAFVPLVLALGLLAAVAHLAMGATPTAAVLTGLAVLVVSCPCALGLATPLAVASGVRTALDSGIVVTDGSVFERATETDVVAFDKTGTLTTGEMRVVDWAGDDATLRRAAAVERFADHPVADAVVAAETGEDGTDPPVTDFETHPGLGVSATVGDDRVVVGRRELFTDRNWTVPDDLAARFDDAEQSGTVPALVGWDGQARGVVVAGDEPRVEWETVVDDLAADGRRVVVITGDSGPAAAPFERHSGVAEVFAGVPPEAKAEIVERLRAEGTTAMVGDGSNDAPALAAADVGISLESGTKLAADAADAVVTTGDLRSVPDVFEITRATRRRVRENLGWAFAYNVIAVPLAAAGLINPLFAAVAMATSSLLVVGNSARSLDGTSVPAVDAEPGRNDQDAGATSRPRDTRRTLDA